MKILIYITTGILVAATLLPLLRHTHWLVRGMDFPRMQLAFVAVCLMLLQLIFLDLSEAKTLAIVSVTTLCLAWQLWWILPYTTLWRSEVQACKQVDADR